MSISKKLLALLLVSAMTVSSALTATAESENSTETATAEAEVVEVYTEPTTENNNGSYSYESVGTLEIEKSTAENYSLATNNSTVAVKVGYVTKISKRGSGLVWKSSNPSIASVDQKGNVMGIKAGSATVSVTNASGVVTRYSVKVTQPVTSVTLNAHKISWNVGKSGHFYPTVGPEEATNTEVTYQSSNEDVATVDENGLLTAVAPGTCTIVCASAENENKYDTCTVTVKKPVAKVDVKSSVQYMNVGVKKTLGTTVTPADADNKKLVWSSTNPSIASVSSTGVVTAKKAGSCKIIAKAQDGSGKSDTCTIIVKQPVTSVAISSADITLSAGSSQTLVAQVMPSNAMSKSVSWSSSNSEVATVNSKGVVTAVKEGTCTITAKATDGSGKKAVCNVTVSNSVTSVKLNANRITWNVGKKAHFYPTVTPTTATNTAVIYTSSNPSVATVSEKGLLTAVAPGTCTITCTATDGSGKYDTCTVTVKQPVTSVVLNAHKISWNKGKKAHFYPTVTPDTATNTAVIYTSSDTSVATVSEKGLLTAVAPGTCTITCTAADGSGKYDTCTVTVKQPVTKLTISGESSVPAGGSVTLTAKVAPTNAANKNVSWSSSNTAVAKVDANGKVTGVAQGKAVIKCTAKDGSGVTATKVITVTKATGQQIADYGQPL